MNKLNLDYQQLQKINDFLVQDKDITYTSFSSLFDGFSSGETRRIYNFLLQIKERADGLIVDYIDGDLVGINAKGEVELNESSNVFSQFEDEGLSKNPEGVVREPEEIESGLVSLGVKNSSLITKATLPSEDVMPDDIRNSYAKNYDDQLNTIKDSRYEIKLITRLSAAATAEKALNNGSMLMLPQDSNLQYVAKSLRENGASMPLQAHCNGVNKSLTILGSESEAVEDFMIYLPADEGVASEIITVDKGKALAVDGSGQIYLINKDPDWNFNNNDSLVHDNSKGKGFSDDLLLDELIPDEDDPDKDNKGAGRGFSIGNFNDLSKKAKHSLAGAMSSLDPATIPHYMEGQVTIAQESLGKIRESGLSPAHPNNFETMKKFSEAMENISASANKMQASNMDFSKRSDFKDFLKKHSNLTNSASELSQSFKEKGSDFLHQGKNVMNSFDFEKIKDLSKSITDSLASALGR